MEDEVTTKLFDRDFILDVQFKLLEDDKIIHAHSRELIKHSVVFQRQFKGTEDNTKLIPISGYKYDTFLKFIRYMYTDQCYIDDENGLELFKLAHKYQVIKLENRILNLLISVNWTVQLFGYCVVEKYEIAQNFIDATFAFNFANQLRNKNFLKLHQDAISKILDFNEVRNGVTEMQIFKALAAWINNYCNTNEISLNEGREKFHGLVKKVRFPTMSLDEIRECSEKYPELLNKSDLESIGRQMLFGDVGVNDIWISEPRDDFIDPYRYNVFDSETVFETKFSVTMPMILHGLRVGINNKRKGINIEMQAKENQETISIVQSPEYWNSVLINLGDSLLLTPNFEYTINVKYLDLPTGNIKVNCRKNGVDLAYNNPENSIHIIEAGNNMLEMCFKIPPAVADHVANNPENPVRNIETSNNMVEEMCPKEPEPDIFTVFQ